MTGWLSRSHILRPLALFIACIALLTIADGGQGQVLSLATASSAMQTFATLGPVALGLGMTMVVREFDLSVAGLFGLAGCIAVLTGATHPLLGIAAALAAGLLVGLVQGLIIVRLKLSSVGVTLGGMLTCDALALVITGNQQLPYDNLPLSIWMGETYAAILTPRSIVAAILVLITAAVITFTRLGRDIIATGSDRQAAATAGVDVGRVVIGSFVFSGLMTSLSGTLLTYSLASASPSGLSDILVPAIAAAIIGGVSLAGGAGRPLGIALGVLILAVLRAGLNALAVRPFINDVAIGAILFLVAVLDGPNLVRVIWRTRRRGAVP